MNEQHVIDGMLYNLSFCVCVQYIQARIPCSLKCGQRCLATEELMLLPVAYLQATLSLGSMASCSTLETVTLVLQV